MAGEDAPYQLSTEVSVHLLDAAAGRPVQSWNFIGRDSITIGRGPEREVAMSDPYVSRLHAELRFSDGRWALLAHGRHGVLVHNEQVHELFLAGEITFRLGAAGPTLRFEPAARQRDERHTLCYDAAPLELFALDETRIAADVREITEEDYFQTLQQRAQNLRRRDRP